MNPTGTVLSTAQWGPPPQYVQSIVLAVVLVSTFLWVIASLWLWWSDDTQYVSA